MMRFDQHVLREIILFFSWLVVLIEGVNLDVQAFNDRFDFKTEEKQQDIATFMVNMMII